MTWPALAGGVTVFLTGSLHPQGSKRAVTHPITGRPIVVDDSDETRRARDDLQWRLRAKVGPGIRWPRPTAVTVLALHIRPRISSEPHATRAHTRKPDLDKLTRALFDALSGVLMDDDAQVDTLHTRKRTAEPGEPAGVLLRAYPTFLTPDTRAPEAAHIVAVLDWAGATP